MDTQADDMRLMLDSGWSLRQIAEYCGITPEEVMEQILQSIKEERKK
jgi:hypothetical protein